MIHCEFLSFFLVFCFLKLGLVKIKSHSKSNVIFFLHSSQQLEDIEGTETEEEEASDMAGNWFSGVRRGRSADNRYREAHEDLESR